MQTNTEINTKKEWAIKTWKELNIDLCEMEFSCGGDSMNDYSFTFFNKKKDEIEVEQDLQDYIDDEVFKRVEFYVNSDGHYMGEFGTVQIILEDDDDEPYFTYTKNASSEWSETYTENIEVELTPEELNFVVEKVSNMNGGDNDSAINYKEDTILTDEEEEIAENIGSKIDDFASTYEMKDVEGEYSEWYNWSTDLDDENPSNQVTTKGNFLVIRLNQSYNVIKEETE
jgi:hypothetical protein